MKVIVHSGVVSPARRGAGERRRGRGDARHHRRRRDDPRRLPPEPDQSPTWNARLRCCPARACGSSRTSSSACTTARSSASTGRWRCSPATRCRTLILVVLTPLTGTPMAHIPPPPTEQVAEFFGTARLAAPATPVNLGCARPLGQAKTDLDQAAIDLGLNGIAYPADGAIEYAGSRGLTPRLFEYCCSLTWTGDQERATRRSRCRRERGQPGSAWRATRGGCWPTTARARPEGLALDEALMASYARGEPRRPPTLRLYTYRTHCALIGRYQNLDAEVDLAACRADRDPGEPAAHRRRRDHHGRRPARRGAGRRRAAGPPPARDHRGTGRPG